MDRRLGMPQWDSAARDISYGNRPLGTEHSASVARDSSYENQRYGYSFPALATRDVPHAKYHVEMRRTPSNSRKAPPAPHHLRMHRTATNRRGLKATSSYHARETNHEKPLGHDRPCCRAVKWLRLTQAIAVAGDGYVRLYSEKGKELVAIHTPHDKVFGVCEGAKNVVITVGKNGSIVAWGIHRRRARRIDTRYVLDEKPCTAMCIIDTEDLVVGTVDGGLYCFTWNQAKLSFSHQIRDAHIARIDGIHGHGQVVATASKDGTASLWDRRTFSHIKKFDFRSCVFSVHVTDRFIAVGGEKYVRLFRNCGPQYAFYTNIDLRSCGVVWTIGIFGNEVLMAGGDMLLTFTDFTKGSKAFECIETSALIVQDAEILPNGTVAVCGNGYNANSILQLPRSLDFIKKWVVAKRPSTMSHTMEYSNTEAGPRFSRRNDALIAPNLKRNEAIREDQKLMPANAGSNLQQRTRSDFEPQYHGKRKVSSRRMIGQGAPTVNMRDVTQGGPAFREQGETSTRVENTYDGYNSEVVRNRGLSPSCRTDKHENRSASMDGTHATPVNVQIESSESLGFPINSSSIAETMVADVPSRVLTQESLEKMQEWKKYRLLFENVKDLEMTKFTELMAAFILDYRSSWADQLRPLREFLMNFFNYNLLKTTDIVGEGPIDNAIVASWLSKALKKDVRTGGKQSLINRAKCFLEQLQE